MSSSRSPFIAMLFAISFVSIVGCTLEAQNDGGSDTPPIDTADSGSDSTGTDGADSLADDPSTNGGLDDDNAELSSGTTDDVNTSGMNAGAKTYADNNCAACHGADGSGGLAQSILGTSISGLDAVLRDSASTHPGGTVLDLTEQELEDLSAFLRATDATTNGEDAPPAPTHTVDALASGVLHAPGLADPLNNCTACHGSDLTGAGTVPSCTSCHGELWNNASALHTDLLSSGSITGLHAPGRDDPQANCASCHAHDLFGTDQTPACWTCHGSIWDAPPDYPPTHTKHEDGFWHGPGLESPIGDCDACHGTDLTGTQLIPSCFACHGNKWEDEDDD
ncbi:MAG: hypothetical protein KDA54_15455 [Phycisphaerales bacterium]|nr:hypothetical protein [Phycisphaerales bacterium]